MLCHKKERILIRRMLQRNCLVKYVFEGKIEESRDRGDGKARKKT